MYVYVYAERICLEYVQQRDFFPSTPELIIGWHEAF